MEGAEIAFDTGYNRCVHGEGGEGCELGAAVGVVVYKYVH